MHNTQKKYITPLLGLFIFCAVFMAHTEEETVPYDKLIRDKTLVAPGIGAEGVLINEDIDAVIKRIGRTKYKISKPHNSGELFKNIFRVNSKNKLYFELMYYHDENQYAVCVFQGKVIAIIGFNNNRVTLDSVNLRSGISSFIYNYGNKTLCQLKSDSNAMYIYPDRGIAVADDGMNDSIDLYLIFKAESSKTK